MAIRKKRPRTVKHFDSPELQKADEKCLALEKQIKNKGALQRAPRDWLTVKEITKDAEMTPASSVLKWAKEFIAAAEADRKDLVKEPQTTIRKVNNRFKSLTGEATKIRDHMQGLLNARAELVRRREEAKIEKVAKKHEEVGETDFAEDLRAAAAVQKPKFELDGIAQRDRWVGDVTDLNAALVAFMEGNPALQRCRGELQAAMRKAANRLAVACKAEDLGVPGLVGVRQTSFVKARE